MTKLSKSKQMQPPGIFTLRLPGMAYPLFRAYIVMQLVKWAIAIEVFAKRCL